MKLASIAWFRRNAGFEIFCQNLIEAGFQKPCDILFNSIGWFLGGALLWLVKDSLFYILSAGIKEPEQIEKHKNLTPLNSAIDLKHSSQSIWLLKNYVVEKTGIWLVVSTPLKNMSQHGKSSPSFGVKINKYLKPPPRIVSIRKLLNWGLLLLPP